MLKNTSIIYIQSVIKDHEIDQLPEEINPSNFPEMEVFVFGLSRAGLNADTFFPQKKVLESRFHIRYNPKARNDLQVPW